MKSGDQEARLQLIESNIRLVPFIANRYNHGTVDIEDLIGIGNIGLVKAIDTYDIDKEATLVTYVYRCVKNEMLMAIDSHKKYAREVSMSEYFKPIKSSNEELIQWDDILGDNSDDGYNNCIVQSRRDLIDKILCQLTPEEQLLVLLRFGFIDNIALTHAEIGKRFGLERSTISRREMSVMQKIKRMDRIGPLRELMD